MNPGGGVLRPRRASALAVVSGHERRESQESVSSRTRQTMAADREERQRIHDEVAAIKVDALKALRELAAQYLEAHRSPVSEISRRSGRRSELIRFMPQRHANGDETHDALIGATHI